MARRRSRRSTRSLLGLGLAAVAIVSLGAMAIAGVVKGASESTDYVQLVNRSFATQADVVLSAQDRSATAFADLVSTMPELSRHDLGVSLDALMTATAQQLADLRASMPPDPSDRLGQRLEGIVASRQAAVQLFGQTVERLLGMPIEVPGSGKPAIRPLLTTSVATQRLAGAGAALLAADRRVGPLRADFARAPGHARLARSVFVADKASMSPSAMAELVAALEASPSLAIVHQVELGSVALRPAALPTSTSATTSLPPSTRLRVTVVLTNLGTVIEPGLRVTATLTPVSGGRAGSVSVVAGAQPGSSVSAPLPSLRLVPGTTVRLDVSVQAPAGQQDAAGLSRSYTLVVAPATPNFSTGP